MKRVTEFKTVTRLDTNVVGDYYGHVRDAVREPSNPRISAADRIAVVSVVLAELQSDFLNRVSRDGG